MLNEERDCLSLETIDDKGGLGSPRPGLRA